MPERPVPLTKEGLAKLQGELEHLRTVTRQEVATQIHDAREMASPQDNPEYENAKNQQAFVEGRIATLEQMLRNAVVIGAGAPAKTAKKDRRVHLGSTVKVRDDRAGARTYVIVGPAEADPAAGRISNESPVGRALLGKGVDDEVEVVAPRGVVRLRITAIA